MTRKSAAAQKLSSVDPARRRRRRSNPNPDDIEDPVSTTRVRNTSSTTAKRGEPRRVASLPGKQHAGRPGQSVGGPANSNSDRPSLGSEDGDGLRYQLASLVRLSDNLVAKAVEAYDRLFALDVRDQAEIHIELGRELAKDGNAREAIAALRRAAKLRPDDGEIRFDLGVLYLERRRAPEAALKEFDQAAALGFESARLHLQRAEALRDLGRDTEVVAELEAALELDPRSSESAYMLGVALDEAGDSSRAITAFRHAIELDPHEIAYHQSLGLTLESAGKRREAIRCFKRALELERKQARKR